MSDQNTWTRLVGEDPEHSTRYAERFRAMRAAGDDLAGEARFIDAMVPRGSHILDAGCGPGRVGGWLHEVGHVVVGVDFDAVLIAAAEQDHPGPRWVVGDLARLDLPGLGVSEPFDAIVCAGNVVAFLAPSTRVEVLRRLGDHLADDGRLVVGFGAGRDYAFDRFLDDARAAGLRPQVLLSSWHLRPFGDDAGFLVAILAASPGPAGPLAGPTTRVRSAGPTTRVRSAGPTTRVRSAGPTTRVRSAGPTTPGSA